MTEDELKFRKIFIVEPSHDFSMAKRYSSRIMFLTDGGEKAQELESTIANALEDFDFSSDAIIPMGKVVSCLIAGAALRNKLPIGQSITVGVFRGDSYEFIKVTNDGI